MPLRRKRIFPPEQCPTCGAQDWLSLGLKPRKAKTSQGVVFFEREVCQCRACRKSTAVLDGELGLEGGRNIDHGLAEKAALFGAFQSFSQAAKFLEKVLHVSISAGEIQRIIQRHGQRIDADQRDQEAHYNAPLDPWCEGPPPPVKIPQKLVLEADATCVLTQADEENKSVYCATAFALEDRAEKNGKPFIVGRGYTASAVDMVDFGPRLKALAWKWGMRSASQTAFVGDGARCLWKWAEKNLPKGTIFIQDFWHACEHLSNLAKDLDSEGWQENYKRWKTLLYQGKTKTILGELEAEKKRRRSEKKRTRLNEEITYLENGKDRMDYPRYRREGWPMGSGAIEGTCKHLVKERYNVTGAQWRRENVPNVLALRLAYFNDEWDDYWKKEAA
jgi:hypothetical protein